MLTFIIAASVTASAFNLNCSGTSFVESWEGFKRTPISENPVSIVIRVDLANKLWCSGACTTTAPLFSVDDSMITFLRTRDDDEDKIISVNRRTGELTDRDRIHISGVTFFMTRVTGSCERAAFSGFPARKF